ncbi:DUF1206 domain-containing protein [Georgenia sp. AZ-5]|uniref:DUF1206 domain-containing protein n=1 Tax=Georgenia sp. AZ-5 TaxID=3367526 RepID=UPI0037540BCC
MASAGIVTVGLGAWFVYRGWTGTFAGNLDPALDRRVRRVGNVARGVSVCVLGGLVLAAAVRHDPDEAGGVDAAFGALLALPLGAVLTGVVTVGLMCFGIFQVATARHTHER